VATQPGSIQVLNTPTRKKEYGFIEVGQSLLLTALAFHLPFFATDLNQTAIKKPVYVQQDQVVNRLTNPIPNPVRPLFSVDLTQVSKRLTYIQQDPVPNNLTTGIPPPARVFRTVLSLNTPKKPVYDQLQDQGAAGLLTNAIIATVAPRTPLVLNPSPRPIAPTPDYLGSAILISNSLIPSTVEVRLALTGSPSRRPIYDQDFNRSAPLELYQNPALAPFFQNDQPNPNPLNRDLAAHTLTAVSITGFEPFNLTDFQPPPKRPVYHQQVESGPNYLPIGLKPPPSARVAFELPPPKRPTYYQDYNGPVPLILGLGKPPPPFVNNDQPNPSRRPISYQDYNQEAPLTLGILKPRAPFVNNDQPNPSRRPISYPDQNQEAPLTLGIQPPALPPIQTWLDENQNPVQGRARYQPDLVPNLNTTTLLPVSVVLPFANYDWPTPARPLNVFNSGLWLFGSGIFNLFSGWTLISDSQGSPWTVILPGSSPSWVAVSDSSNPNWGPVTINRTSPYSGGVT